MNFMNKFREFLKTNKKGAVIIMASLAFLSISWSLFSSSSKMELGDIESEKYSEPPVYDDSKLLVIQGTPRGQILLSDGRKEVYLVFNQPLVPLAALEEETRGVFTVSPEVKGKYRWYGSRICSFIPDERWSPDTEYTVKVAAGTKSLNNRVLEKDHVFKFRVEVPELGIRCSPYSYGTIDYDQNFTLRFDYPVKKDDLAGFLKLKSGGRNIPFTLKTSSRSYSYDEEDEEEENSTAESSKNIVVVPSARYGRGETVVLDIRKGLKSEKKDSVVYEAKSFEYKTHGPLVVTFDEAGGYYQELWNTGFSFTNYVDLKTAVKAISFYPAVKFREKSSGRRKSIGLAEWQVKPGVTYTIRVNPITDVYGNRFEKPLEVKIKIPDYYPAFNLDNDLNLLEAESGRKLPLEVMNMQNLEVGAGTYTIDDIQKKLTGGYRYNISDNISFSYSGWNTGLLKNQSGRVGFDVSKYLNGGQYGWFAFRFKGNVYNSYEKKFEEKILSQVVQATNLAVTVKEDFFTVHAWVSSLSDGKARKGIKLTLLNESSEIGNGVTDGSGYCVISKKSPGMVDKGIFLASDAKGDRTYLTTVDNGISMYGLASYSSSACERSIAGDIVFDRKLYRPGDEVFFKGIITERFNGQLKAFSNSNVKISIENSSGENVFSDNIKSSGNGGVWGSWKIPSDAPLGHYQVRIETGAAGNSNSVINDTFQVEEFRPVTFSVDIEGLRDAKSGESLTLEIDGKYLFGAPMNSAPVKWSFSRSKEYISFERFDSYTFGDNSYLLSDDTDSSGSGFYSGGDGKLSAGGKSRVDVSLKQMLTTEKISNPDREFQMGNPYTMSLEATVKDVDDKTVTKSGRFTVFPGNFLIGIKQYNSYQSFNRNFSFDLVAVTNSGGDTSGRTCSVRVIKNTWKSIKSKGPEGSLQTRNTLVREIVHTGTVSLSSNPYTLNYRPKTPGIYTLTVQDAAGMTYSRTGFYAYGGDSGAWDYRDDDSVTLIPDKSSYKAGETAKVLIQSPFKNCKAIITLERETVYWRKTITLDGSGTPVEVPIRESYTPNVFLSVMLVRPRVNVDAGASAEVKKAFEDNDLGAPQFKAGIAKLNISSESKRAKLEIVPDRDTYSPGDRMKLKIKTEPGAEIVLSVADRGVLDLLNYSYSDPVKRFYSDWLLGVRIFHNMNLIIKQYKYALKGGSPGGSSEEDEYGSDIEGDMPGGGGFGLKNEDGTRRDIKYTAFWKPDIKADSSGNAELEFKLPDNLTTFRIMAMAAADGKFSSFKREFKVRKAMVIQKNLPRFIRTGDRLMIGGTVINQTGLAGDFRVSIESELLNADSSVSVVNVKPGESREVLFPVTLNNSRYSALYRKVADAVRSGNKDVDRKIAVKGYLTVEPVNAAIFSKAGFDISEVKDRLYYEFPVKEYPVEEAFTVSGFTDDKETEMIKLPDAASLLPEFGGFSVGLSSTALVGLNKGFSFYKSNPYFCLEQRASAFVLMMSSGKLLKEFSFNPPDGKSYDFENISRLFLDELESFRNSDGGFRLWKERSLLSGEKSSPYLTSYVAFVLLTARERGYSIDNDILEGAINFLKGYMKEPDKGGYSYVLESLSFINYVNALYGIKDDSLSTLLLERKKDLSLRAKGFLVLALSTQKGVGNYADNRDIKSLFESFKNSMDITTQKIMFKEQGGGSYKRAFYSEGATLGVMLKCFMRLDRNNPLIPGLVRHILDSKSRSYWDNTHGIAFLALALDEYRELYEKGKGSGEMTAKVILGSKEIFSTPFKQDSMNVFSGVKSFDELWKLGREGESYPLIFRKEGGGRLYYTATLQYYPMLKETRARDEGIEIRRTIYDVSAATEKERFGKEVKGNLKRGDIYLCRVVVVNPKPFYNAVIVDPLPSTVEILNTSFETEKKSLDKHLNKKDEDYYWWDYSVPVTEYRDDRVVITEEYLSPGMHEYTYLIRPIVKGRSGAPSATAKLMYEPEIFGRSGNGVVEVK